LSRFDRRKAEAGEEPAPTREKRGTLAPLIIFIAIVVFIVVALVTSRSAATERPFSYTELLMDTEVNLQIFCRGSGEARRAKEALFDEMKRLERLLSYSDPKSDLARINRAAGERPVEVSPETVEVIQKALDYSSISEGAFDPTVAPLLELWGFREGDYRVPDPDELEEAGVLVDYRLVEAGTAEVYLPRPGMALDLGGIAKGYIVDRGLALLSQSGVRHALINAGGDIGILGPKADGSPWRVGIKHPCTDGEINRRNPLDEKGGGGHLGRLRALLCRRRGSLPPHSRSPDRVSSLFPGQRYRGCADGHGGRCPFNCSFCHGPAARPGFGGEPLRRRGHHGDSAT